MKKYLMLGVAAIAFLAVVTSCSKSTDLYDQDAQNMQKELVVNKNYAAAFEKAFGTVGSNVDWGFSSKIAKVRGITRSVGTYAGYRGSLEPTISFPEDAPASNFLDAVPTGVEKLPADGGGPKSWYIDESTTSVSTWAGASKIYVTGNVDLSGTDAFAPSITSEIYLVKGATLKLGTNSAVNFQVAAIYIAQGATLETAGVLKANTSTKVYNHGTIKAGSFEPNTSSFLYNVGTLNVEYVNAASNPTRIVNDGTIYSATVRVDAGAVQNNAEWNVSGTTTINSNNSGWVNNGHWTTNDFAYIGGSENVINNCYLEVENDFETNISSAEGAFKISNYGGVLTKNFYGGRDSSTGAISGPFKIMMGNNAVFKVEETAQFESGRDDTEGFGIYGPESSSSEYAVFQAKNIVRDATLADQKSKGAVTYVGNLYVSAETHFAQYVNGDEKFIYTKDGFSIDNNIYAAGFNAGKPNINIPETPCSPGFNGGTPLYRVIAEDLSAEEASDFDFNDVVFDVVKAEGGKTTLKLICAGGVLPLKVMGIEVHGLFGETAPNANGEYKMYNTGAGPTVPAVEFTVDGEYTTPAEIKNIKIEVMKSGVWMELKANTGEAACKILVDSSFEPVEESKNIANEYGLFTNYVQGSFVNDFWWK